MIYKDPDIAPILAQVQEKHGSHWRYVHSWRGDGRALGGDADDWFHVFDNGPRESVAWDDRRDLTVSKRGMTEPS